MTGCTIVWLPGKDDFCKALWRLGFQPPFPGPRILNPRGVPSIPAGAPLQAGSEDTPAGGTPRKGRSPTPGGSAQRPRRGTRSTPAPATPPAVPLHNLRLLLRSMAAVLRRDTVRPPLIRCTNMLDQPCCGVLCPYLRGLVGRPLVIPTPFVWRRLAGASNMV